MPDLFERLEEMRDVIDVLNGDVERLRPRLGPRSIQDEASDDEKTNRRSYVRAIFALIEAVVEQHKRLLLDLSEQGVVQLGPGVRESLLERTYSVKDNGSIGEKEQYLPLQRKLRAVYRAAAEVFGQPLELDFAGGGWRAFCTALDVRDRITHPKTFVFCQVEDDELGTIDCGHEWFRDVNQRLVGVAERHRQAHGW